MLSVHFRKSFAASIHSLAIVFLAAACGSDEPEDGNGTGRPDAAQDGSAVGEDAQTAPSDDASVTYPWEDAEALPIPPDCGDGERLVDSTEECDDGNNTSGDGCDARCLLEPGFLCAQKGGGCESVCGDAIVVDQEACDDGNAMAGDGCSQMCAIEEGYACPVAGEACEAGRCGDSLVVGAEACDDGNDSSGDGCSDACEVEAGWLCSGAECAAAACGDGVRAGNEQCDDGNTDPNDGCVPDCSAREPFFSCPVRGGTCLPTTVCGDGTFTANEKCDDGNLTDGDGCDEHCEVESGFTCPGGITCETTCGDGIVAGLEQCDDHNTASLDGCSASCALEVGFDCATAGVPCTVAVCGNGKVEGLEQCDDGQTVQGVVIPNNALGDGCTPSCTREPSCSNGECVATCGDGIVAASEACDDGNRRKGDGCSADCSKVEPGFTCQAVQTAAPEDIYLPLVLRDFRSFDNGTGTRHPDFNGLNAAMSGIVRDRLGVDLNNDGVADTNPAAGSALSLVYALQGQTSNCTTGAVNFNDWYHDNPRAKTVVSTLRVRDPEHDGTYVFSSGSFFPLDGKGWQASSVLPSTDRESNGNAGHNFGFTSEVRFWFTFKGTEVLNFTGDDDVWVFINNRLAVDLGGVHSGQTQTITFNSGGNAVCSGERCGSNTARTLGLTVGKVYEAVVFQAERHENASNYALTLGNFISAKSVCTGTCGDGVRTVGELCDDGKRCEGGVNQGELCTTTADCDGGSCVDQNTGAYGHCNASCNGKGAHCGDGHVDVGHEACDDGAASNDGSYTHCNPDCTLAPRCGDNNVDSFFGETCDQGSLNKNGVYGRCSETCRLGARCGDGTTQADKGEECDDGFNRSGYGGCAPGCKLAPYCGDGLVQSASHEMCDLGADANVGGYGGCDMVCRLGAFCGDGHTDYANGEECDDANANNFDGCSANCKNELILK